MSDPAIEAAECLHRSVPPGQFDGEEVSMEAFNPTSKDEYRLSVDRNKVWTARSSYVYRTTVLAKRSVGIWSLECDVYMKFGLSCAPNKVPGNDAHSLVDFSMHDKKKRADLARRLAYIANNEAWSPMAIDP